MCELYSVESRKGGVGKTTIALNLAKALVKKKYDVLLIDCDITGTPITKAVVNSIFWKKDVVVSVKDGKPINLIDFFCNSFLRGYDREQEIIKGFDLSPKKIHVLGSEIYNEDGDLIIDPRNLMDDLHSYWFMDLIKRIVTLFCKYTEQDKKAVVLDNSPGYVGIGRSVREWLTKEGPEKSTFVLVSSLDEQDIDSTISSAAEIQRMMSTNKGVTSYVKVVVNKVPEGILSESGGYGFNVDKETKFKDLVDSLFPIGRNGYPNNIIKYDMTISGQFIEASLKPKAIKSDVDLESAIRKLQKKITTSEDHDDKFSDITSMNSIYKEMLKALSVCGYVRLSNVLKGDLMPSYMVNNLKNIVGKLGSVFQSHPTLKGYSREVLKDSSINDFYELIKYRGLEQYYSIFLSLNNGLYKMAGYDRKDANGIQMYNLRIMLAVFCEVQMKFYHKDYGEYRSFLKDEINKKNTPKRVYDSVREHIVVFKGSQPREEDTYITNLLNAYFDKFYHAMCYTILRMIDCKIDYGLLVESCIDTINMGAKMMSEDLTRFLKEVISKKSREPDLKEYRKLIAEPYEMKTIQDVMKNLVLKK